MIPILLERLSSSLLLPVDQISAALCLLLAFPFAFFLHHSIFLPSKPCRLFVNFFAIGPTYFFLWICFYVARPGGEQEKLRGFVWDMLSVHLPIGFTFVALKCSAFLRKNPLIIFAALLAQLSYHHLSRQLHFYNQYTVNITGPLMILIIKLSAFAFDVRDGKIAVEGVGIGSFAAWALLFAGFFTGPVVHYKDFEAFCERKDMGVIEGDKKKTDDSVDFKKKPVDFKKKNDDSVDAHRHCTDNTTHGSLNKSGRKRRASFLILSASLLLIFGLFLQPHFPTQNLLQISESSASSLAYRLLFLHFSLLSWRIKYYVAWLLAEGALVIIGLGYIVKDNKIKWNRFQNVNFLAIETSCDFRTIISEWNVSTNRWLNQYIYQRLGRTFFANLSTYLVSAFWHGFYPGYYLTFVSGALYTALTRLIYKKFTWPLPQKYRRPLLYIPNYLVVDYFAAPFALQTFQDSWRFWRAWGFYGHFIMISVFVLIKLMK